MRPATALAVDIANYAGYLIAETVEYWQEHGVKKVVVRASTESVEMESLSRQQLKICSDAGLEVEAYVYLDWGRFDLSINGQVNAAIETIDGYPVKRLWLDCEESGPPAAETIDLIRQAINACKVKGMPTGIYTARWWWVPVTDDFKGFAGQRLWVAQYDGEANLDVWEPFGGWQRPTMKQYAGTTPFGGVGVDLNVYEG